MPMVNEPTRNRPSRLKLAIVASGLTSAEVATLIGKDRGQLARWTTGARECPQTARLALASVLDTTVEDLFPPKQQDKAAA